MGQCMYLHVHVPICTVSSEGSMSSMNMETLHAQKVVVKRNACTEDNTQRVGTSNQWPVQTCMHNSSLINGTECVCMSQCL